MILITVDRTLRTASVCHKDKIIFRQQDSTLLAIHFTLDGSCDLFVVLALKNDICDFRVKLEVNSGILKVFLENQGKALSRDDILEAVWGHHYVGELKIVDVNVRRLRLKIEDDAQEPKYISTVWGFGYKWTV